MGCYVNPPDMPKELWLVRYGTPLDDAPPFEYFTEGNLLPVILIDNGAFTAAGIGYYKQEYEVFTSLNDRRSKIIYAVPKKLLEPYL